MERAEVIPQTWHRWLDQKFGKMQRSYEKTSNPLFAWTVIKDALEADVEIPEFALNYLHEAACNTDDLISHHIHGKKVPNVTTALAEAMQFKKPGKGGRGNVFSAYENERKDGLCRYAVARKISAGDKRYLAVSSTASMFEMSESTVYRALKDHGTLSDLDDEL